MDTRNGQNFSGTFGPPAMPAGSTRTLPMPGKCGLPLTAKAYALNVSLIPTNWSPNNTNSSNAIDYVKVWPTGYPRLNSSTVRNPDQRIIANNTIVAAGMNGALDVYIAPLPNYPVASTDVFIDVNGYFTDSESDGLVFYPVTPCRVADTRLSNGPFGGPILAAATGRNFAISSLTSPCPLPSGAQAYYLNITVVPTPTLGYLTVFPAGTTQPVVSTLNAMDGYVLANGGIFKAGLNGDITLWPSNSVHAIIDIAGYFAPPNTPSAGSIFNAVNPCRGTTASNGTLPVSAQSTSSSSMSGCSPAPPNSANAFAMNVTLQPNSPIGYLTVWPQGQSRPVVSLLNAVQGIVVSNGAITPTVNGNISAFIDTGTGNAAFDLTGYFTPATSGQFYDGALMSSNCGGTVTGWIRDLGSPNSQVYVTVFDNGIAKASGYANQYLGLGPTAGHDFSFNIGSLGQGSHAISVKVGGWQPPSSPALVSCLGGTGGAGATSCPTNITPPTSWRGIYYSPREHPYWKMLDDWFDPASANMRSRLASLADQDLEQLKNSGFNLVHLYLWDRNTFTPPEQTLEPTAGFPYPDPSAFTATNQWAALDAFFTLAETKGIWVYPHFVRPDLRIGITESSWATKASDYKTWTRKFVDKIAPTHCNVAAWGLAWETFPGTTENDPFSRLWRRIYKDLKDYTVTRTPNAGVGVDLRVGAALNENDGLRDKLHARGSGYNWNLAFTTNQVQLMADALTEEGAGPRPDYYNIQLFNSNASDMKAFLNQLTALDSYGNLPSNHIPAAKIYVPEFSAATSLDAAADGIMNWGDNQAPATTQFVYERNLSNTLCAFQSAGITKHSHWGRFDGGSYFNANGSVWQTYLSPLAHAWWDNWGVGFGLKALGEKSAWPTIGNFYQWGGCNFAPQAAVALQTDGNYFTINQSIRARWTAVDYTSLSLAGGTNSNVTEDCTNPASIVSGVGIDASCGSTTLTFPFAGQQTITLTASNPNSSHAASRSVTIGSAPILTGVANLANQAAIGRNDTIRISGAGFRSDSDSGYPATIRAAMGSQIVDLTPIQASRTEIIVPLNNQLSIGTWAVTVNNGLPATTFSNSTQLKIDY